MSYQKNQVFFSLLRAGLWEQSCQFSSCGQEDLGELIQLAQEQSVEGLVAAG